MSSLYPQKFVYTKEEFPKNDHWAIIIFGQHRGSYDGVEGQVDMTNGITDYYAYDNEEDWAAEVIRLTEDKYSKSFVAVRVSKPASTKTTIVIEK